MRNITVFFLMALAIAAPAATASQAGLPGRRNRFLLANALPVYDCSKKSAAVCLAPGSPGATCCGGQCVDTVAYANHCGWCNKVCNGPHPTCCGGRCVDLISDKVNCGRCGNQCKRKCNYGFCEYA
ncbi:stigma-specific STIG1-like protein 4 [Phragmites australis]|uniref:stigma-specific STIG1-like protein 4 n=1 Tax=Phragmites australis TaxID=29695 RepID=UPI002D78AC1C|nr:stigma-specific STIG1-like protein 4 [Phragmites australis]